MVDFPGNDLKNLSYMFEARWRAYMFGPPLLNPLAVKQEHTCSHLSESSSTKKNRKHTQSKVPRNRNIHVPTEDRKGNPNTTEDHIPYTINNNGEQ